MADGGWRASSLGDGEKERTNESTQKTVLDGNCNWSNGLEREGAGPTTGRRQAAGYITRYDGWNRADGGPNAAGRRFAAWIAVGSVRRGPGHARSGAARRRVEYRRLQEQFQIQGADDGAAGSGQRILFAERRGDSRACEQGGTGSDYGSREAIPSLRRNQNAIRRTANRRRCCRRARRSQREEWTRHRRAHRREKE